MDKLLGNFWPLGLAIFLLFEYLLVRVLGQRFFKLLPHLLAVVASFFLNFLLAILSLALLESVRLVKMPPGDGAIGEGLAFIGCSFGIWLIAIICYQIYGFFAGLGCGRKALVIGHLVLLAFFCSLLVFSLIVHTAAVLGWPFFILMVFDGNFWGILFIDKMTHAIFGGRPQNTNMIAEPSRSPETSL